MDKNHLESFQIRNKSLALKYVEIQKWKWTTEQLKLEKNQNLKCKKKINPFFKWKYNHLTWYIKLKNENKFEYLLTENTQKPEKIK